MKYISTLPAGKEAVIVQIDGDTRLKFVLGRTKDTFFRVIKVIIPICAIFWLLSYTVDGMAENTILYKIGNAIEPVTKVFGLNWKLFTAYVASSVGKEGAVGVLTALYSGTGSIYGAVVGGNAAVENQAALLLANIAKPEALAFIAYHIGHLIW